MIDLQQAQDIVRKALAPQFATEDELFVADWGYQNDEWWDIQAGSRKFLVEHKPEYAIADDTCYLVNKQTGEIKYLTYYNNLEFFDDFKPFGEFPPYFS